MTTMNPTREGLRGLGLLSGIGLLAALGAPATAVADHVEVFECPRDEIPRPAFLPPIPSAPPLRAPATVDTDAAIQAPVEISLPVELEADTIESPRQDVVVLRGSAQAVQGGMALFADELSYDRSSDEVEASGNVVSHMAAGHMLQTDHLKLQTTTHIGQAGTSRFSLADRAPLVKLPDEDELDPFGMRGGWGRFDASYGRMADMRDIRGYERTLLVREAEEEARRVFARARGDAEQVHFEGHDIVRLERARYTTCEEGNDAVYVLAREITLDQSTGTGIARHMQVRFFDVPVFYWPYVTFPITSERKSGFLYPSAGHDSESGTIIETPYYFNLAPTLDATVTPRVISRRGLQVSGEFRYLGEDFRGIVEGEFLPSDDLRDDDDRSAARYTHEQTFTRSLRGDVDFQWVSDRDYLQDFESDVRVNSTTHLPQQARLRYNTTMLEATGRLFAYQTVDPDIPISSRPYDRFPQITFRTRRLPDFLGFEPGFEGELVDFRHNTRLEGTRIDLTPSVKLPMREIYGFIEPELALRHTSYRLRDTDPDQPDNPSRTVPVFSVDSGLFFERDLSWGQRNYTQTLEPRLFYVYVPEEDQEDLPVFDTGVVTLDNLSGFFQTDRFRGADRVGDTHQISSTLTTRFLRGATGEERFRATIGQIFYLSDREVTLFPGQDPDTRSSSDTVGEVRAQIGDHWQSTAFLQFDNEDSEIRSGRFDVRYDVDERRRATVGYSYAAAGREQVFLQASMPMSDRWTARVDQRYDIEDSRNLETRLGLEYNACCWVARVVGHRRVDFRSGATDTYRNSIFFELELSGFGAIRPRL